MAKNAVLVIADERQLPPAAFLASRLAALKGDRDIDIIVATDSARGLAELKEFAAPVELLDVSGLHAGVPMPTVGYFTRAVYHCLFVPPLLAGAYDRVLYMDADVYPESDRVFSLFDLDMGRHAVAAVRDLQVAFVSNDSNDAEVRDSIGVDIRAQPGAKIPEHRRAADCAPRLPSRPDREEGPGHPAHGAALPALSGPDHPQLHPAHALGGAFAELQHDHPRLGVVRAPGRAAGSRPLHRRGEAVAPDVHRRPSGAGASWPRS